MTMPNNKPPPPARPTGPAPNGPPPSRKSALFDAYLARMAARAESGDGDAELFADAARRTLDVVRAGEAIASAVFGQALSPMVVMECSKLVQQNAEGLGLYADAGELGPEGEDDPEQDQNTYPNELAANALEAAGSAAYTPPQGED